MKKLRKLLFLLIFIHFSNLANAQGNDTVPAKSLNKNVFLFELLGPGLSYSFNYGRLLQLNEKDKLFWRIGASANKIRNPKGDFNHYAFPLVLSVISGKTRHHSEIGFGLTWLYTTENKPHGELYAFGNIGYIYQKRPNGTFFKIAATPYIRVSNSVILGYFGLGIGKPF